MASPKNGQSVLQIDTGLKPEVKYPTQYQQTLILAGSDELFRDDIEELARKLMHADPASMSALTCKDHLHVECVFDPMGGLTPGEMAHAVWDWL